MSDFDPEQVGRKVRFMAEMQKKDGPTMTAHDEARTPETLRDRASLLRTQTMAGLASIVALLDSCADAWEQQLATQLDRMFQYQHELEALQQRVEKPPCEWKQDVDDIWNTTCGNSFALNDGKPSDNDMRFCAYCGGPLVEVVYPETYEEA